MRFKAGEDHSARPAPLENGSKSIKSPKIDVLHKYFVLTLELSERPVTTLHLLTQ